MRHLIFVLVLVGLIIGATEARAAMSCGNSLVDNGMTKLDVISKCGVPDLKEIVALNTVGVDVGRAFRASTSSVEAWHYNCGEGRFNKSLYFDGGALALIKASISYGSGTPRCN
jgi:hypothetical protein